VSGGMSQSGTGAYFYLIPARGNSGSGGPPTASCTNDCADGGSATGTSPPAGSYRLRVVASVSTRWSFNLTQNIILALSVTVTQNATGTTTVTAHGLGNEQTKPFRLVGPITAGKVHLTGGFQDEQAIACYLVPAREGFDPTEQAASDEPAGTGGGWIDSVPTAGEYYLVVKTTGPWSINFTSGQ
jgi:hypothetical protein